MLIELATVCDLYHEQLKNIHRPELRQAINQAERRGSDRRQPTDIEKTRSLIVSLAHRIAKETVKLSEKKAARV